MDVILQAYIGAMPLFIGLIVYLVKKKKLFVPSILFGVQIILSSLMIGLNAPKPISEVEAIDLYESYKEMEMGNFNQAMDIINKAFLNAADRVEITLAKARLYVMQGSWEEAVALYEKVMNKQEELLSSDEIELVESIKVGDTLTAGQLSYQSTNIHYLKDQGVDPVEFGFLPLTDDQIAVNVTYLDDIQNNIIPSLIKEEVEQMEEEYSILADIDKIDEIVDVVMSHDYNTFIGVPIVNDDNLDGDNEIESGNDSFWGDSTSETPLNVQPQKLNEKLVEYKDKYPALFEEDKYLEAYIFSEILAGNKLDDLFLDGGSKAYDIISNMYMSGIITEDNFSDGFAKDYKEVYEEVLKQCQEVASELSKTEDINKIYVDGESVVEIIQDLNSQDNFALQQIAQDMNGLVEEELIEDDKLSDIYLTMSVIANEIGNEDEAKEFFNEAVSHSSESSDKELAQLMGVIADAYDEGGDDLDYIEIADAVADVYEDKFHYDIVSNDVVEDVKGLAGSTVSETLARVNIGKIEVGEFPEIIVSIQHSGDTELSKDIITLKDCGIEIEDYTLEKKQYDSSKVILLCDVSGSMRGSIDQLIDAVSRYIKSMGSGEQVNIVLFSDKIDASSGFSTNKEELLEFAQTEIYVRGGTMICESTYESLGHFANNNIANTLIVMTDGDDYGQYTEADMETKIGGLADANNVTIYTIGLGADITPPFLTKLANVGGGKFLYCSNITILEEAFQFIHERINSEYIIKFSAEDLDSTTRLLEIEIDDGMMKTPAKDSMEYRLKTGATEDDPEVVFETKLPEGIKVKGLDVNQLSKSTEKQLVNILGSGFDGANITNVYLESTEGQSNCKIKEIKDGSITFQIAPSVSEGIYSVFVTIDGKKYKVDRLVIGDVNTDEIIFGAYHFKADVIETYENQVILSGNVVLNDYLYFDGDVTLEGNINRDSSVALVTNKPAYVHHDTASYSALDKLILSKNTKTKAFDWVSVNIYDDGQHYNDYENYQVEMPWTSEIGILELGVVSLEDNIIYVYPDRVEVSSSVGVLKDNTITDLLTNGVEFFKIPDGMPYLKGEIEAKSRLMKMGPFTYFNMDVEAGIEGKKLSVANFLTIEGKVSAKLMYDTYNREFEIGLTLSEEGPSKVVDSTTEVKNKGDAGITLSIVGEGDDRRHSDKFFNMEVALPLEVSFVVYGVPVTLSEIKCSLENYNITQAINNLVSGKAFTSSIKQYLANKEGADLKVSGSLSLVSTDALPANVGDFVRKWLGDDVSLLSVDDLYGSVGINYPHLAAGATVNVLGCVEIAKVDLELGAIEYPDYVGELLNASDGQKHYGLSVASSQGIKFDWDAVGANITGNVGGTVTLDRFLMCSYVSGVVAANVDINIFGTGLKFDGEAKVEQCSAIWVDNSKWKVDLTIVASADGTTSTKVFGINILEKEVHSKTVILDESVTFN